MRYVAALVAVLMLAAGCSMADHNNADVDFATGMIEHHAQAIQMANFTIGREGIDPRIGELAEEIRVAQTGEIDRMADWLRGWGEPVPETGFATGDSHAHEMGSSGDEAHSDLPGMMTSDEMGVLAEAPDEVFARMWIEMMIEHHEGAIAMSAEVADDGRHDDLAALAAEIAAMQALEVRDLQRWLDAG